MARTDPYVDLISFKTMVGVDASDTRSDAVMTEKLLAASRQVDQWCGRFFGQSAEEALSFTACHLGGLIVDDLVSVTEVVTELRPGVFGSPWLLPDYQLTPVNAAQRLEPYTGIRSLLWASIGTIRITGVWGWPSVPDPVREATALQANRLWKRAQAPFGIAGALGGGAELGQIIAISSLDPDVKSLLAPFRAMPV